MKNVKVSLAWQILLALVLGILLGSYLHYHSDSREWLIAKPSCFASPTPAIPTTSVEMTIGTTIILIK